MFHFVSVYTARVAGTGIGVSEPQAPFSACFGARFLPQPPVVYARMLGEKLVEHGSRVWLVNTGWTCGRFAEGERVPLEAARALLRPAHSGARAAGGQRARSPLPLAVPGRGARRGWHR